MNKIASFTVNHLTLLPGIYVSRKDKVGEEVITTFDIRMTAPNREPVINTAEIHKDWAEKVIYFGPMGCRTGFYMILAGDLESKDVVGLVTEMFTFMAEFEGDVPGAAARDCGNYLDMNLPLTKIVAKRFLDNTLKNITEEHLVYPD